MHAPGNLKATLLSVPVFWQTGSIFVENQTAAGSHAGRLQACEFIWWFEVKPTSLEPALTASHALAQLALARGDQESEARPRMP